MRAITDRLSAMLDADVLYPFLVRDCSDKTYDSLEYVLSGEVQ